jgi:hypothetical protein
MIVEEIAENAEKDLSNRASQKRKLSRLAAVSKPVYYAGLDFDTPLRSTLRQTQDIAQPANRLKVSGC